MMKTIRIPLIRDLVPEADESFGIVISNVVGARPRTTPAPITIAASGLNHVQVDDLSGAPEGFQPSKSTGYQTSQSRRVAMMDPYMVIPKAVTTAEPAVLAVFGSRDGAYRCTLANPPSSSSGEMWICDDTRIAHVSPEGRIRVWQVSNGGLIRDAVMPELPLPDNPSFQPFPTHMGGMEIGFPTVSADGTVSASIVDLAKGTIREAHLPSSLMTRGTPVIVSGSETFAVATMELILNEDADPRWSRLAIEFFDKATMEPFGSYRGNLFSTTLSDTSRLVLQPVDCGEHFYLAVPDAKCFDLRSGEPVWTTSDLVDRYPESRNRKVTGGDGFLLIGGSTNLNDDPEAILVDPDSLARLGSVPRSSPTIVGAMLISGRTMEVDYLSLERELPAIRFNFSDLYIDEGFSIEAEMAEPFDREVTARWSLDTTAPSPVFPRIETYLEADEGLMTVLPGTKTTERVLMKRTTELWPGDLTIAVNTLENPGGIPYQPATHLLPVTRSAMPSPPGQRLSGLPDTEIGTVDRLEVSDRWVVAIVNGARSPVTGFTTDYRLDVYDRDSLTHRRSIPITTDLHDGRFGTAGAIHGDLLLISAPAEDGAENPNLLGRVHLFNLADGSLVKTFTNTLRILNFSESIASGDNYFAIGAWGDPPYLASFPNSVRAGFVVYRWSDLEIQWTMTSGGQQLGTSLQFDEDTLYASAPNHTGRDGLTTLYDVGAIFVYDPATRRQIGEINPPVPQSRTEFGKEIHLRNGRLAINWAGLIYQNTQKRGGILIYDLAAGDYSGFVGTTDRGTVPTHSMALSDRHLVTRGREFVISDAETGETRVTASIDIVANSMTRWVFGPGDEFFYGVDHEVYRGSLSELAGFRAWQTLRPPDSPESGFDDYLNHHLKLAQDPISSLSSDSPGSVTTLGIQPPRDIPRDVICHLQWSADLSRWKTLASANSDGVWEGADGEIEEDDSARLILDVHDPSGFFRFDFEPHPLLAE